MSEQLTYAVTGGPPDEWWKVVITDLDTGLEVQRVLEVDASAGWLIRQKVDSEGKLFLEGEQIATERLEGRFALSLRD